MRMLLLGIAALGVITTVGETAWAAAVHEGVVVRTANNKITMTDADGKNEHSHTVTAATEIFLDGKDAKLEDLKKGYSVIVTTSPDMKEATKIDAKSTAKS
jgi:hypothetical protein